MSANPYIDRLRALIRESGVTLVTAVQVPNPARKVVDIGVSPGPLVIHIDYAYILRHEN